MAITCTPENLMSLSECFLCLTALERDAIKTYLLAVIAGASTEPATLMASAKCFTCLTPKQLKMLQPYLMCLIANGGDAPPAECGNVEGAGDPT